MSVPLRSLCVADPSAVASSVDRLGAHMRILGTPSLAAPGSVDWTVPLPHGESNDGLPFIDCPVADTRAGRPWYPRGCAIEFRRRPPENMGGRRTMSVQRAVWVDSVTTPLTRIRPLFV